MPKRVLITDDALFMRSMLKNLLGSEGYATHEAANGEEAIREYRAQLPDVVLMDITMPVMDGIAAIRAIMSEFPNARIIVCSALGQRNLVVEAIQAGAKDYIVKPFDKARVIEGVANQVGPGRAAA
jgi:two-component system chemotaxis response regulator CheY